MYSVVALANALSGILIPAMMLLMVLSSGERRGGADGISLFAQPKPDNRCMAAIPANEPAYRANLACWSWIG
jgi:hypothetical protein